MKIGRSLLLEVARLSRNLAGRWHSAAVAYPLVVAVALVGCKASPGGSSAAEAEPKVAFLLSTLQEERYKKDQKYFEDTARSKGLDVFTLSADNDNARQLSQVEDALARRAKVLVIQPTDSAAAGGYVLKAHAHGAKVIAYDRSVPGADFHVAHDSYAVGVMQAQEAVKATHGQGNYVLLNGQSGHSVASEIARGYHETLKPYVDKGAITIVVEKNNDAWSPEQALKTVEDAISKTQGHINAILANNSGMARGAVQAIQAAKLGDRGVFIAGADADAANVNYVCEGKQSVEVLKEIEPLAREAATVAAEIVQGRTLDAAVSSDVPTVSIPVVLIKPDNVKAMLIDTGFHSAAELPSCVK
jgi:D-xylose transport system substrate-binding protein